MKTNLTPKTWVIFDPNYLSKEDADKLYRHCISSVDWRQESMSFGGKNIKLPRLTAWYGDAGYFYSGIENKPMKLTNELREALSNLKIFRRLGLFQQFAFKPV
jgi:hypothetical protein